MTNNTGVQFDEEHGFAPIPEPELEPPVFGDVLIKAGIVANPRDVSLLLGILAVALIAGSFYMLASAVPPVPELGADTLRPGETVPQYRQP